MIPTLYPIFRHWSEGGSVYILSDLHLDDADCKLMDANWITPEEQIKIINQHVLKSDTFICLGDVGNEKYIPYIQARKKILILGNHDAKGRYSNYFTEIYPGPLFVAEKILLSHEPIELPFCLNIHGHDHSGSPRNNCINVAANVHDYAPLNLGKIIKSGILSKIDSIHRITIDKATENSMRKDKKLCGKNGV